jgi:hypothetical protein
VRVDKNLTSTMKEAVSAAYLTEKAQEIERVLSGPEIDLWKLRELALSEGGLVNGKETWMF